MFISGCSARKHQTRYANAVRHLTWIANRPERYWAGCAELEADRKFFNSREKAPFSSDPTQYWEGSS